MEITKMLTISTGHVQKKTANALTDWLGELYYPKLKGIWVTKIIGNSTPFGWDIKVPDDLKTLHKNTPPEIRAAMHLAQLYDCTWVRYESSAPYVDELTQWFW